MKNSLGMEFALVPPGQFVMGSPVNEQHRCDDEIPHLVHLTEPFYLGVYEVTQEEFVRVMGKNPSGFPGGVGLPVENVSWDEAAEFCRKLSSNSEEQQAGRRYRLPTEAEWEYACRAGTTSAFSFGNSLTSDEANFDGTVPFGSTRKGPYLIRTQPVGSYQPNAFGLYDMHGNVWEWCSDWYSVDYYLKSPSADPRGPPSGTAHVIRGGSWYNAGLCLRSAYRYQFTPPLDGNLYGFRVACTTRDSSILRDQLAKQELVGGPQWPQGDESTSHLRRMFYPTFHSGALFWSALLLLLLALGDFNHLLSLHNVHILALQLGVPFLFLSGPISLVGICLLMLYLLACIPLQTCWPSVNSVEPNLAWRPLVMILVMAFSFHVYLVLQSDATQKREQPEHKGPNVHAEQLHLTPPEPLASSESYALVSPVMPLPLLANLPTDFFSKHSATTAITDKVVCVLLDCLIMIGLVLIGRRWQNVETGLCFAIAYAVLPYTSESLPNWSHLASITCSIWALVFLQSPLRVGLLLMTAIAADLSALFLVPLWLSYYHRTARWRMGLAVACATTVILVAFFFEIMDPDSIFEWPLHHGILQAIRHDLWHPHAVLLLPNWLILLVFCLFCFVIARWPRSKNESVLISLTSVVLLGSQLCLSQGGDSSFLWSTPWLVLAVTSRFKILEHRQNVSPGRRFDGRRQAG